MSILKKFLLFMKKVLIFINFLIILFQLIFKNLLSVPFWEDLKDDDKENYEISEYAEFLKRYVKNYPERPMLRLQKDDRIKVKYQDKWYEK